MPNANVRANARTMSKAKRRQPTENDFIDDLAYLPDRYGMICVGDCLMPEIASGATLIFDKREPFEPGDFVLIYRRRDLVQAGQLQSMVKRLVLAPPPWVTFPWRPSARSEIAEQMMLETINPPQRFLVSCADVIGMHKCVGVAPQEMQRVDLQLPHSAQKGRSGHAE